MKRKMGKSRRRRRWLAWRYAGWREVAGKSRKIFGFSLREDVRGRETRMR